MNRLLKPLIGVALFLSVLPLARGSQSTEEPVLWETLFKTSFEDATIMPPPANPYIMESYEEWKWYPEGPCAEKYWDTHPLAVMTTDVVHSGRYAVKMVTVPPPELQGHRACIAAGTGNPAIAFPERRAFFQFHFWMFREFIEKPTIHSVWIDIELFDGKYDRMATIGFDAHGNMAHAEGNITDPNRAHIIIDRLYQFELQPETWYFVRIEVDFRRNVIDKFHIQGPGLDKTWEDMNLDISFLPTHWVGIGYYIEAANDPDEYSGPSIIVDDVEGGLEAVPPVTTETTTTTPTTTPTTTTTVTTTTPTTPTTTTAILEDGMQLIGIMTAAIIVIVALVAFLTRRRKRAPPEKAALPPLI